MRLLLLGLFCGGCIQLWGAMIVRGYSEADLLFVFVPNLIEICPHVDLSLLIAAYKLFDCENLPFGVIYTLFQLFL